MTRVGLEPPTSGSGVRGDNHQATTPPSGSLVCPPDPQPVLDVPVTYFTQAYPFDRENREKTEINSNCCQVQIVENAILFLKSNEIGICWKN